MSKKTTTQNAPATKPQDGSAGPATGTSDDAADNAATGGSPLTVDRPDTLRQYFVRSVPIRHNGQVYAPGVDIDLTDAEAARLSGAVSPNPVEE